MSDNGEGAPNMAEIVLYHHIQGLTEGVRAFADQLRGHGHTVHTPDLFDGRTFSTIPEGFAYAKNAGLEQIRERGREAACSLPTNLVYGGFSFGVTIAQHLAQTRPGARGAVFLHSCLPVSEFSESWPERLPAQIHGMSGDEFFDEDLPAARALAGSAPRVDLFEYPGDEHLFTDASLNAYNPAAAALVMTRITAFLAEL